MKIKLTKPDLVVHKKITNTHLFAVFIFSILFLVINSGLKNKGPHPAYLHMAAAAQKMQSAIKEVHDWRLKKNINISSELDPAGTGFIGEEFTPITTTLGNLEAKQTSINPDFAALFVKWLSELKLKPGDRIGLQFSGSFPALGIAAIIACEELQLEPRILSSIGASSYGANIGDLTYPDIESHLFEKGIIGHRSAWITPGGNDDNGSSLWDGGFAAAENAALRSTYHLEVPSNLAESIRRKMQFYDTDKPIKAFINIGGNQSALGSCPHSPGLPTGLVKSHRTCKHEHRGLIMRFFEQKVPVIHMLDIRSIAVKNGIRLTPVSLPQPGKSDVYFEQRYSKSLLILSFGLILFSILILRIR